MDVVVDVDEAGCRLDEPIPALAGALARQCLGVHDHPVTSRDGEVGWVRVPERRADRSGRAIELRFLRLRADAAAAGAPIVYLEGGPGASGVDAFERSAPLRNFLQRLREHADVVVLDQRGTGGSRPNLTDPRPFAIAPGTLADAEAFHAAVREHDARCAAHWRAAGVDLSAYNSRESADDLEDLRLALGVPRLNLVGFSYGSHLALAAVRRHRARLESAVLIGPAGPDHLFKLPGDVQRQLERIARLSNADPAVRADVPDLLGLMRRVLERAARTPIALDLSADGGPPLRASLGRVALEYVVFADLGDPGDFARFPRMFHGLERGDDAELRRFARRRFAGARAGTAVAATMRLASGASPGRRARIERERPGCLVGDAVDFPFGRAANREVWGVEDLGDAFRAPITSDLPALFLSGTLDGNAPVARSEAIARGFSRATHVVYENSGHEDFFAHEGTADVVLAFLRRDAVPPRVVLPAPAFAPAC